MIYRSLYPVYILTFIRGFGVASYMLLYPLYLLSLNYAIRDIGGFTTLGSLPVLLLIPFFGYLVDLGWSREILLLSGLSLGLAMILPVLLPYYPVLILSYTLLYISMYTWMPGRMKAIALVVPTTMLGRVYGLFSIIFNGSRTITPFILGRITYLGYGYLLLNTGLIVILVTILMYIELLYSLRDINRKSIRKYDLLNSYITLYSFHGWSAFPLILFTGIDAMAWRLWFPILNAYFKQYRGLTDPQIGDFMTFVGVSMLVTSYIAGSITDYLKPRKSLIIYELLGVFGVIFLQFEQPLLFIAAPFIGFSIAFWVTAYNSLITTYYGYNSIGRLRAVTDMTRAVTGVPAPLVGGYLMSINPLVTYTLSLALMLTAIVPLSLIESEERH